VRLSWKKTQLFFSFCFHQLSKQYLFDTSKLYKDFLLSKKMFFYQILTRFCITFVWRF
jgi:hypothetical protein